MNNFAMAYYYDWLVGKKVNPMEPNESIPHNYFKELLPTFNQFYLAGEIFSNITDVVTEPYYKDYIAGGFPYPKRKADIAFKFKGKNYFVEFVYSNKNVDKKIAMARQYKINLIIIYADNFYSNSKIKEMNRNGEYFMILDKFDTFIRNLLMNKDNRFDVSIFRFS